MPTPRREWLTLLGASATMAIAGCSDDSDRGSDETEDENGGDGTTDTPVSEIVLSGEDIPDRFGLQDRTPRTENDVSDQALELGWKEGYRVEFASSNTYITHAVSRYPPENISGVWEIDYVDRATDTNMTVEELPEPDIGTQSKGYRLEAKDSDAVTSAIRTTRADIYQVVTLTASGGSDYEFTKEMARIGTANVR